MLTFLFLSALTLVIGVVFILIYRHQTRNNTHTPLPPDWRNRLLLANELGNDVCVSGIQARILKRVEGLRAVLGRREVRAHTDDEQEVS
jgi:hypothetical protein